MAIAVYFPPNGMTKAQYDDTIRRLDAAGQGSPQGRTYHACFGDDGDLQVFDVWTSQSEFDTFGKTLMPILQEVGIDVGQPMTAEVHNIIEG